jgi:magnesium-transporting ATPase (P-type)
MSSHESGLSSIEAARRLAAYDPNEPAPIRHFSALVELFHLFANPLVIILLVATAIAGSLGARPGHRQTAIRREASIAPGSKGD